jgi:hypothetical protein
MGAVQSTFRIYYPLSVQVKIDQLSHDDGIEIFQAVRLIYPLREYVPEVTNIDYQLDFNIIETKLVEAKDLRSISFEKIQEQISKCHLKIETKDYDGAVTNARTLIKDICLYILESITKQPQENDGNLINLHKKVATLLQMSPGSYDDKNIKQILSGVFSIISGVSGIRNVFSDSHGSSPSKSKYKIDKRHTILVVNLAKTISEYLFQSYELFVKKIDKL